MSTAPKAQSPFKPARRIASLPVPATIAMAERVRQLRAEGRDVISLAIGQPDFPSPAVALEGAVREVREGHTGYPPLAGQKPLREAVQAKFRRDNGLDFPLAHIMVANGGKQLIFNAFMASVEDGDEIVVPAPYWVSYPLIAGMFGGKAVEVPCYEADGFRPRAEALRAAMNERTKWLVLNFPNNPTGAILERSDLEAIAAVLRDFPNVMVMSDEIYEHLTFDGRKPVSLLNVAPDLAGRVLIVNGVSKAYAMTGWRVGFAAGPEPLIKAMIRAQGNATSGICTLAQGGAQAALQSPMEGVERMRAVYQERRDKVVPRLRAMKGLSCAMPEGAFYAFPGMKALKGHLTAGGRTIDSDVAFTEALLEEAHLATVPGSAFGQADHFRLSFAASDKELEEACARLERFTASLRPASLRPASHQMPR
ncbi:pyridoxal phosphate-dependent aminotransferase [Formicincola oecophyllae]|uniref:Aminotransferase n=1 Tax=Formicincola oecophyllae TaxID=2558361 RepID=A0A4Y6U992_9PROT|nr:pyridoxal phosphate-dependent aminotransferase [Formicincola oecophyllae]QDH13027.1 pyridoxal phosphate-dependent aminotransferase [Formicincola oecophyllae]